MKSADADAAIIPGGYLSFLLRLIPPVGCRITAAGIEVHRPLGVLKLSRGCIVALSASAEIREELRRRSGQGWIGEALSEPPIIGGRPGAPGVDRPGRRRVSGASPAPPIALPLPWSGLYLATGHGTRAPLRPHARSAVAIWVAADPLAADAELDT